MQGTAQRFALVVCGRDEIRSEDEEKLEARKMLENRAESHKSTARFVRQPTRNARLDCNKKTLPLNGID